MGGSPKLAPNSILRVLLVGWDWGTPAILQQNRPFVWLWFWFEKVGLGRAPPPSVGTKSQKFPKIRFEGSPNDAWSERMLIIGNEQCYHT